MTTLANKRVLLIVGGGIAAYKAAPLVRDLRKSGAEVRAVMTRGAQEFITPMTLQVLTENRVGTGLFEPGFEYEIGHIELARWPDVIVVAPATANLMARMRAGMADDLATTVLLATTAPVLICPSMNSQMWFHPATRDNVDVLASRQRHTVLDPDSGELACKEVGPGRLPDPEVIRSAVERVVSPQTLAGRRVTVTAGPTREHLDPVRFLSNPSSGRMGLAVAAAAYAAGADVTIIRGPIALDPDHPCRVVDVTTAAEMAAAVFADESDILVKAAAVADYRPAETLPQKRKKGDGAWSIAFERTVDILGALAEQSTRPRTVIGFAAETENVEANTRGKLERKGLDGIVGNSVAGADGAFGNADNRVLLVGRGVESRWIGPAPKRVIADAIVQWIADVEAALE